ncbi:MAG: hypothetical protein WAK17_19415 [Candidatus Nitrosopolaris sp.]|jgi:hypothetical protein
MFPEIDPISNESVHHFVRGEASEFVITELANMGVVQAELEMAGLIAHQDIMNEVKGEGTGEEATEVKRQSVIVELKEEATEVKRQSVIAVLGACFSSSFFVVL